MRGVFLIDFEVHFNVLYSLIPHFNIFRLINLNVQIQQVFWGGFRNVGLVLSFETSSLEHAKFILFLVSWNNSSSCESFFL